MKRMWFIVGMLGVLAGCGQAFDAPKVVGNGVHKSETRAISEFDTISTYGVGTVTVAKSESPSLKVRAEENMLPYVKSEVSEGVLRIGVGAGTYEWHGYPETEVTVNGLRSVEMKGQTSIKADGIEGEDFQADADGQCDLTVAGSTQSQTVVFAGQSSYSAAELKCRKTTIRCSGQCHLVVCASEELNVDADGNCTVEYIGNPTKKNIKATGASRVIQREAPVSSEPSANE